MFVNAHTSSSHALWRALNIGDGNPYIDWDVFVMISAPACRACEMVIVCANAIDDAGRNYQQTMHATCIYIDARCFHMANVQSSLLDIPAIVIHGNALSVDSIGNLVSRWLTSLTVGARSCGSSGSVKQRNPYAEVR
nr:hypothetical protein [uncultured Cupriavidus sp.]